MGVISFPDVPLKSAEGSRRQAARDIGRRDLRRHARRRSPGSTTWTSARSSRSRWMRRPARTPVSHPQDRRDVGLSQQRAAAAREARQRQVQRAAGLRLRSQAARRLDVSSAMPSPSKIPRRSRSCCARPPRAIATPWPIPKAAAKIDGEVHEGARSSPTCSTRRSRRRSSRPMRPQGKPIGWQEAADWEANLSLAEGNRRHRRDQAAERLLHQRVSAVRRRSQRGQGDVAARSLGARVAMRSRARDEARSWTRSSAASGGDRSQGPSTGRCGMGSLRQRAGARHLRGDLRAVGNRACGALQRTRTTSCRARR